MGEVAVHERHVPRAEELVVFEEEDPGSARSMPTGHGGRLYTRSRESRREAGRCRECSCVYPRAATMAPAHALSATR